MQATLRRDGSLELTSETETRVIRPQHPAHKELMILYHRHAKIALSAAQAPAEKRKVACATSDEEQECVPDPGYGGHPWKKGTPRHDITYSIPVEEIHIDPERFQYQDSFDPALADLPVWKDPADRKTYVVAGLHRVDKARLAGVEELPARYIEAETAAEALAIGDKLSGQHQGDAQQGDAQVDHGRVLHKSGDVVVGPARRALLEKLSASRRQRSVAQQDRAKEPPARSAESIALSGCLDSYAYSPAGYSAEVRAEALRALRKMFPIKDEIP